MMAEVLAIQRTQRLELEVLEREDLRGDAVDRIGRFGHADSIAERPSARPYFCSSV